MFPRSIHHVALASLLLASLAQPGCGGSDSGPDSSGADPASLFAQGDFAVGYRRVEVTYPRALSSEMRTISVDVWYPAPPDSPPSSVVYDLGGVADIPTDIAVDAPSIAGDGPLPLVVYSHGLGAASITGYALGERLSSHGFVVASVNHNDGQGALIRATIDRPNDIRATLDWLESPTEPAFEGRAATDNVLMVGQSFGGFTTLSMVGVRLNTTVAAAACSSAPVVDCALLSDADVIAAHEAGFDEPRISAIVPQTPAFLALASRDDIANIDVRMMLQSAGLDQLAPRAESGVLPWNAATGSEDIWVEVIEGGHYSFTTGCFDLSAELRALFLVDADNDGCGDGFIDPASAVDGLSAYTLGFARSTLLSETAWDEVLRGPPLRDGFDVTVR